MGRAAIGFLIGIVLGPVVPWLERALWIILLVVAYNL